MHSLPLPWTPLDRHVVVTIVPQCRKLKELIASVVLLAVFLGFLLGFLVHRCYRAFSDVAAEDARRRFQSLYADPNTEIEDLPASLPGCDFAGRVATAPGALRF
jgi:hypothetical protein